MAGVPAGAPDPKHHLPPRCPLRAPRRPHPPSTPRADEAIDDLPAMSQCRIRPAAGSSDGPSMDPAIHGLWRWAISGSAPRSSPGPLPPHAPTPPPSTPIRHQGPEPP
ncbi:hypothetical protein VPH35_052296 [Triticum aestivum]